MSTSKLSGQTVWIRIGTLASLAIVIALMKVLSMQDVGGRGTIPSPGAVATAVADMSTSGALHSALGDTLYAWAVSLALASVIGIALGILTGLSEFAYASTRGLFDFIRSIPPVALIPVVVLILGVTTEFKVVLSLQVCVWPIVLQTSAGVHQIHPLTNDAARSMNLTRWQRMRWLVLPGALPFVGTGVRLSAILALLVCIGSEMLAGVPGLGQLVYNYQATGQVSHMWATIVIISLVGIVVGWVFTYLDRALTPWLRRS